MHVVYFIFVGLIILIIWLLTRKKKTADGIKMTQSEYSELYSRYQNKGVLMPRIDTRFYYRYEYHCALYQELRRNGFSDVTARLFTSHASKAQRGWKDSKVSTPDIQESPGKLWNFNCFGVKAFPDWREDNPYFIADTVEMDKYGTRYVSLGNHWRAYRNLAHSVFDYLSTLRQSRYVDAFHYAQGLTYVSDSHAREFARLLKTGGYYTGDPVTWGASIYNIYRNIVSPDIANHCGGG